MTREFKKLNENATLPERAAEHSAGQQTMTTQMESESADLVALGRWKNERI